MISEPSRLNTPTRTRLIHSDLLSENYLTPHDLNHSITSAATIPLSMKLIPEKKKLIPEKLLLEKALKREYSQPVSLRMLLPTSLPMLRPLLLLPVTLNLNSNMTPIQNHPCTLLRKE